MATKKISELTAATTLWGTDIVALVQWTETKKITAQIIADNIDDLNTDITTNDWTQTLTDKTINLDNNTLSNIETDNFKTWVVDTDWALAADSDTKLASQKAVKTYVDNQWTNINWIAEETVLDWANDEIIFYDSSATANRKRKAWATETLAWLIPIATDTEAATWTATNKALTPANSKSVNIDQIWTAWDITTWSNIEATQNWIVYMRAKEAATNESFTYELFSDATATPTTSVAIVTASNSAVNQNACYPIKKWNYYRIDVTNPWDVVDSIKQFIPLW